LANKGGNRGMHLIAENKDSNLCCIYERYGYKEYIEKQIALVLASGTNFESYKAYKISFQGGEEIAEKNHVDLKNGLNFSASAFMLQVKYFKDLLAFYELAYPDVDDIIDVKTRK
jgi:hypothetical protein